PGKLASMFLIRIGLHDGELPSIVADSAITVIERMWDRRYTTDREQKIEDVLFVRHQRYSIVGALLSGESILGRSLVQPDSTHFEHDAGAYSTTLFSILRSDRASLEAYTSKWLTRERARTLLVKPEKGARPLKADEEETAPAGRDDAPPTGDAAT